MKARAAMPASTLARAVAVVARRPDDGGGQQRTEIDHRLVGANAEEAQHAEKDRIAQAVFARRQRHRHAGDDGGEGGVVLADDEEGRRQIDHGDGGDDDAEQHGIVAHPRQRQVIKRGRQSRRAPANRPSPAAWCRARRACASSSTGSCVSPVDVGAGDVEVVEAAVVEDVHQEGRAVPEQPAAGDAWRRRPGPTPAGRQPGRQQPGAWRAR